MLSGFKEFLLKQNIVALALAVVVGAALNKVVTAFVDDFIMPVVGVLSPGGNWRTAQWHLGPLNFGIGDFLSAVLGFVIVAFVAWRVAKLLIKETPTVPMKSCPFCKSQIDATATRCAHCTSELRAAA
jgi:large conductance mechanosensitive channel